LIKVSNCSNGEFATKNNALCSATINLHTILSAKIFAKRQQEIFLQQLDNIEVRSMVLTYSGQFTLANTIAPLLHLSELRKILNAPEADTLEGCIERS
jgi:hypothetical protein